MAIAMLQKIQASIAARTRLVTWPQFARLFIATFGIGTVLAYVFVLLIDPYNVVPFSLPIERPIISINQRYMYPQVVRSGKFDSFVVGTSTSRLLDPEILNAEFHARFANLAMDSATAWEQKTMANYFFDQAGPPKAMIVGIDWVWCTPDADRVRTWRIFPDFLYDNNRWNDYLYLLNSPTLEMAGRLVGYHLHLYPARSRYDGYEVFVPPESRYDLEKVRHGIYGDSPRVLPDPNLPAFQLDDAARRALQFPALAWLDEILQRAGNNALKIIAFMPVHMASQPAPSTEAGAEEAECKARIVQIAAKRGAKVIDWRYSSVLTREDSNYWDSLHSRVPIAQRLAHEMGPAILEGRPSADGTYRLLTK